MTWHREKLENMARALGDAGRMPAGAVRWYLDVADVGTDADVFHALDQLKAWQ